MAEQYFLYTVTGLREPFYAAVDHDTGRVWTAPTKDSALRQASDAGITEFVEKTITREKFLRSLGIEGEPVRRTQHDTPSHREPPHETPKPAAPGSWFVVDENAVDDDSNGKATSIPPRLKTFKNAKPLKGGSPFAAGPIGAPIGKRKFESDDVIIIPSDHNFPTSTAAEGEVESDDVIIIPSNHNAPAAPTPFTDVQPTMDDDTFVG